MKRTPNKFLVTGGVGLVNSPIIDILVREKLCTEIVVLDNMIQGAAAISDGLRIFDFHPTYVALNMNRLAPYLKFKQRLAGRRLFEATQEDFRDFVNHGTGGRDFLKRVIDSLDPCSFKTVSEICKMFRKLPQPAFQ